MNPMDIVILLTVFAVAYFFKISLSNSENKHSYNSYFLAQQKVTSADNRESYVARFTSLATVLSFFLIYAQSDGLALLFAPLTVLFGVLLFLKFYNKSDLPEFHSLDSFLSSVYNSRVLGIITMIISAFSLIVILLIEIYVGVGIFDLFVSNTNPYFPITVFFVSGIVFIYVAIGGFGAVIKTDRIQSAMIYSGILFLLLVLFTTSHYKEINIFPRPLFMNTNNFFTSIIILPVPLFFNVLIVNLFLLPSLLSTWQIAAASENVKSFSKGIKQGGFSVFILWSIFILCGILLANPNSNYKNISEIFIFLRDSRNVWISFIAFPVLFIGAIAALLSTADSAIIPLVRCAHDKIIGKNNFSINLIRLLLLVGWILIGILYILIFSVLKYNFIKILFTVFGLSVCITPVIFFGLWRPSNAKLLRAKILAIISVSLGFFVALLFSFLGSRASDPVNGIGLIQLGAPIGFIVSSIFILFSYKNARKEKSD